MENGLWCAEDHLNNENNWVLDTFIKIYLLQLISFTKTLPLFNNILTIEDQVFYFNNNTVIN